MDQATLHNQQAIDTRLPFRTGWPRLPTFPVQTSWQGHNHVSQTSLAQWEDHIDTILEKHNVHQLDGVFEYRYNNGIPLSERKLTYRVFSDLRKEGQDIEKWQRAVTEVRDKIQQEGIDIAIEILDHRFNGVEESRTYGIIFSHEKELLDMWAEFAPRVIGCLSNHNWTSLDLLHEDHESWMGLQDDCTNTKATVVIGAADANHTLWDETLLALGTLLPSCLGVKLRYLDPLDPLNPILTTNQTGHPLEILRSTDSYWLSNKIPMGASCGRRWKEAEPKEGQAQFCGRSGTLGGLVKFQDDHEEYGLSNHHVFFEGKDLFRPGSAQPPEIVSPSNFDKMEMTKTLDLELQEWKKLDEKGTIFAFSGERSITDELQTGKDRIQGLDAKIGTIFASSGERSITNEGMKDTFWGTWKSDWCLIKISDGKKLSSTTPDTTPLFSSTYQSIDPFKLYNVMKFGRTSRKTTGTVSAAMSFLRTKDDKPRAPPENPSKHHSASIFMEPGEKVLQKGQETKSSDQINLCYAIRNRQRGNFFMESGDSGCFILSDPTTNENLSAAPIVGLGFGVNGVTGTAYMMPFDLVVSDIEKCTGRKIVQPRKDGEARPEEPRSFLPGGINDPVRNDPVRIDPVRIDPERRGPLHNIIEGT